MTVHEDQLPEVHSLLGKINSNLLGQHLPHTLRVKGINYGFDENDLYTISLDLERSESPYGHNFVKNPTTGAFHEIRNRDGSPLFDSIHFPDWVLNHIQ